MIFSVIIAAYNSEKWIKQTINSLIKQDLDFKSNVEVIIVDDNSFDNTQAICEDYINKYPDNFKYVKNERNEGPGVSRNIGLKYATGNYVNFLDSDDTLSENTLKDVLEFFKLNPQVDVVSIPIYFFGDKKGEHYLNYKFKNTCSVDLLNHPDYYHLSAPSSFFRRSSTENIMFPDIITSEDVVFTNEILVNNPYLGLCNSGRYNYRKRSEKTSIIDNSHSDKKYYTDRVENYFYYLIEISLKKYGYVPQFIQNVIMYDVNWMLSMENINKILNTTELNEYKQSLKKVLEYIDDEIIINQRFMSNDSKLNCLFMKYGTIEKEDILNSNLINCIINTFEIIENKLYVLASIIGINNQKIDVCINDKKIGTNELTFDDSYLDCKRHYFEFSIPLSQNNTYTLEFKYKNKTLPIDFSRSCNFSRVVGYSKTKHYISVLEDNKIQIKKKTTGNWIRQELKTLVNMVKIHDHSSKVAIPFRIAYMLSYPFLRNKRIWFYMDRPDLADDNGMHLFKYSVNKDPEIKKYFILNKDSPDFNKMKEIGPVIKFKSLKHRFLGLYVENIITSHPDNNIIYPFWGTFPHLTGLIKSSTMFLQHGIIKDDISSWLNKSKMNLSLFLTSYAEEYESCFNYNYNYDKSVVQMLGMPRFDCLKNEERKKQIIIMPSWRRDLTRKSDEYIINSEYFKRFNSLINNPLLIEKARENNYKIIFKPHPNVYNFIEHFDENDYVKIADEKTKYQTLFNNGSLLITDYSSVAFDFAYLYKPVIYYHYSDDYHFDLKSSFFNYETMGFGEICKSEEDLIRLIIDYIEKDCKIKEKYSKRISNLYVFHDKNNCKRAYEAIKKIPPKD